MAVKTQHQLKSVREDVIMDINRIDTDLLPENFVAFFPVRLVQRGAFLSRRTGLNKPVHRCGRSLRRCAP
jgi:hypothetical protein